MEITEFKFACCFCNKSIESSKTDPADINILINFDKDKEYQRNQSFYCHVKCFEDKLHSAIKIHFFLPTILDDVDDEDESLFKFLK